MSIWQTKQWKELLLKSNGASEVYEIDGVFIEKRSLGMGQFGLFALGVGENQKINEEKLIDFCKKENALFVQIESFLIPTLNSNHKEKENTFNKINTKGKFKKGFYKKFITPYTALIDLSQSEDDILKNMKPKGRYNIRLALKKGVEVYEAEKTTENIDIFYDLMLETTSRDGFAGNKKEYYKNFLDIILNSSLIFTKIDDKVLSAGIFVFDKEISIYYYGASSSDKKYRNLMAPYLMQWEAITKAKEFGSKYYDFLGVADPSDKNSSLAGVTDFKLKLTPDIRRVSQSYIWVNNIFVYNILIFLKKIKTLLRNIGKTTS